MTVRTIRILALFLLPLSLAFGCIAHSIHNERPADSPLARHYRPAAERIIRATLAGNDAHAKLEELCDDIGHRISGSPAMQKAVEWAARRMAADGHENVHTEKVMVPHWVRGRESCTLIEPREYPLSMLGLGGSVGTPEEGITAEVEVVSSEAELETLGTAAAGKIILFNNPMPPYDADHSTGYGPTVRFRGMGARIASEKGAVAVLVRSVTARSLRTPHTGATNYRDAKVKIPAAAITVEDASMLARLRARGKKVVVHLKMEAKTLPDAESANVIAELRGSTHPHEIVVIGGHLDAWDVGHGAHDDGAGVVICMEALNVLRKANMRPRRTIRVVLFTNEENGLMGGRQYAIDHAAELKDHVAAIESDSGGFAPRGFSISVDPDRSRMRRFLTNTGTIAASQPATQRAPRRRNSEEDNNAPEVRHLAQITALLDSLGADRAEAGGGGADISPMAPAGVPLIGQMVDVSRYFDYHHTPADTFDHVNPRDLSQATAAMAVTAYVLADMPGRLGE